jgi:hypothetical protein
MANSNRTNKGRFQKGTSGNQDGRPPGSRNRATIAIEQMLEGEAEQLTRKAIELAKQGDIQALRLCLERLAPPRRERSIQMELRPIQRAQDLPVNVQDILKAIAESRITPVEGQQLASILSSQSQTIQSDDMVRRVESMEGHLKDVQSYRQEIIRVMQQGRHEP